MYNKNVLYDTFNAKYLNYQEVAHTFIPNNEFTQVISNNHTLLMGPRGCGKTTLLKMLTPTALHFWNDSEARYKDKIPFTAIYIPTDIQWKNQLSYLSKHLKKHSEFNERVTYFLVNTNIQIEICRTFNSIINYSGKNKKEQLLIEEETCKKLIQVWNIEAPISPSFDDLEIALNQRVDDMDIMVSNAIYQSQDEGLVAKMPAYVASNFLNLIKLACKSFETSFGLSPEHRWALCFDELELAPYFLQIKLYSFLRSVDQKFLFKLTTTPLVNIQNQEVEASQDNDFKPLRLWVYDDTGLDQWKIFCEKLVSNKFKRQLNFEDINPVDFFGEYSLNEIIKNELNIKGKFPEGSYKGSLDNLLFKALSDTDATFKEFLEGRKINSVDPIAKSNLDNKSVFLKHKVNVLYRYIFRYRTRKTPPINYGIPYIYEISDGNPRAIISIVDEIFSNIVSGSDRKVKVSPARQTEILMSFSKRFFDLVKNHPDSTVVIGNKAINIATDILKKIGNNIYAKIIKDSFDPSIATTFVVDASLDPEIIKLLEHALFLGAIIYLDPIESLSNNGIVNKRFRLSYLLTPNFRIPSRVNGVSHLNAMLSDSDSFESQIRIEF